jgi:hypothetical protein
MTTIATLLARPDDLLRLASPASELIPALIVLALDPRFSGPVRARALEALAQWASAPKDPAVAALEFFVSSAGALPPGALPDALDALSGLCTIVAFRVSTPLLLASVSLAVFALGSPNSALRAKAVDLLKAIHGVAEARNNCTVLISTNSVFALFPDVGPGLRSSSSASPEPSPSPPAPGSVKA